MAGFSCVLEDVTHEVLAQLLNDNTIDDEPAASGVPGFRRVGFHRGVVVVEKAILVIIHATPYEDYPGGSGLVYYPAGAIISNLNATVQKGEVMMVPFAYEAREYIYTAAELTAINAGGTTITQENGGLGFWDWEDAVALP